MATYNKTNNRTNNKTEFGFALGKENYRLLAIGFVIIIIGFILMAGKGSDDPAVFDPSIYGFRQITLAPIVVLAGFIFEVYAIMKKPKDDEQQKETK